MTHQEVLSKARKLQALTASSEPHEAALALKRLQILLAKHALSEADLVQEEYQQITFATAGGPWARVVTDAIAKLYFCRAAYTRVNTKDNFYIYGDPVNITIAKEVALLVIKSITKQAQSCWFPSEMTAFKSGAAMIIRKRCDVLIEELNRDELREENGTALVVGNFYRNRMADIAEYLEKKFKMKAQKQELHAGDRASFERGALVAQTLPIQKSLK